MMESFIPLIIMMVLGAIMSGKRKAKSSGESEAKPFTAGQKQPGSPVRTFKEVSTEMYKEIQREFQQEPERQQAPQRTQLTPPTIQPKSEAEVSRRSGRERRETFRGRKSTRGHAKNTEEIVKKEIVLESLVPKSKDDLIKGVIFSEIFGPPKSKR
jgi:hypothetical protein